MTLKKWLYKGVDAAELKEVYSVGPEVPASEGVEEARPVLKAIYVELTPGGIFEAPDDWRPSPFPHPLFESAEAGKRAKATATEIPIDPASLQPKE